LAERVLPVALRIVVISDTHSRHRHLVVPAGDILVHAGDLTARGTLEELQAFDQWLGTLPHAHKLVIAGNHDWVCAQMPSAMPLLLSNATYAIPKRPSLASVSMAAPGNRVSWIGRLTLICLRCARYGQTCRTAMNHPNLSFMGHRALTVSNGLRKDCLAAATAELFDGRPDLLVIAGCGYGT
jgi:hypothetical protein